MTADLRLKPKCGGGAREADSGVQLVAGGETRWGLVFEGTVMAAIYWLWLSCLVEGQAGAAQTFMPILLPADSLSFEL